MSTTSTIRLCALLALAAIPVLQIEAREIMVRDTGSMRGWLPKGGAWLHLEAVPFSEVSVGQVIVYHHRTAGLVAHRVIEAKHGHLWTKGDSNPAPDDEYVTPANYMGVVTS